MKKVFIKENIRMGLIVGRIPEDVEMFLNMPQMLYVLRMDADGIAVGIEEHELVGYPRFKDLLNKILDKKDRPIKAGDIREWGFGELVEEMSYQYDMGSSSPLAKMGDEDEVPLGVKYDLNLNTLKSRVLTKRIMMTLEKAGVERVADYSIRKEHIDRAQNDVRNALKEYVERVDDAWRLLQGYIKGIDSRCSNYETSENIRRERNTNNLSEYCSISYTYYVFEKPFMKLVFRLGNRFRVDPILTVYDIPSWEFDFMNGGLSARRNNKLLSDRKTFGDWMEEVFKEPENASNQRKQITGQIEKTFGISHNFPIFHVIHFRY